MSSDAHPSFHFTGPKRPSRSVAMLIRFTTEDRGRRSLSAFLRGAVSCIFHKVDVEVMSKRSKVKGVNGNESAEG